MTDLVATLRARADKMYSDKADLMRTAADEIQKLREALEEIESRDLVDPGYYTSELEPGPLAQIARKALGDNAP